MTVLMSLPPVLSSPSTAYSRRSPMEDPTPRIWRLLLILWKEPRNPITYISTIKGNRPYKKPGAVPLQPQTDENECLSCGVCARECPTGAIDPVTLATDKDKCITCCRCIAVCDSHARKFKGIKYATVGKIFCSQNSKRREPELFF